MQLLEASVKEDDLSRGLVVLTFLDRVPPDHFPQPPNRKKQTQSKQYNRLRLD